MVRVFNASMQALSEIKFQQLEMGSWAPPRKKRCIEKNKRFCTLFVRFKDGEFNLSDYLDAVTWLDCNTSCVATFYFNTVFYVGLVLLKKVDLVTIDFMGVDLITSWHRLQGEDQSPNLYHHLSWPSPVVPHSSKSLCLARRKFEVWKSIQLVSQLICHLQHTCII